MSVSIFTAILVGIPWYGKKKQEKQEMLLFLRFYLKTFIALMREQMQDVP
jgi:hypothetical protein